MSQSYLTKDHGYDNYPYSNNHITRVIYKEMEHTIYVLHKKIKFQGTTNKGGDLNWVFACFLNYDSFLY